MELVEITRRLSNEVETLAFGPPVHTVYNPLRHAWGPHRAWLERYGADRPRPVVLLGMNPGPWGMVQTGIPFGDPVVVRDWLGIQEPSGPPAREHPKRPVRGIHSPRREVSGRRLWGWVRDRFGAPEPFFERFFVVNYCPLAFMEETGRNRTPDKLRKGERVPLFAACDRALRAQVEVLRPQFVVGIGAFAEARARRLDLPGSPRVGRILHPSPASPRANRGWAAAAEADFRALGVELPSAPDRTER